MIRSAKLVGAGLATISLAGSGVGIGVVFASLIGSIARNPALLQLFFLNKKTNQFSGAHNLYCIPFFFSGDFAYWDIFCFGAAVYIVSFAGFWSAYKSLPIEKVDLKYAVSNCFGALVGIEVLFLSGLWIDGLAGWTPLSLGLLLVSLFWAVCSILHKGFREELWKTFVELLEGFLTSVEKTVAHKLGSERDVLWDEAFVVFYLLFTASVTTCFYVCWANPLAFQLVIFVEFVFHVIYVLYHKQWKKDYTAEQHVVYLFDTIIKGGLILSLLGGYLFSVTIIFFSLVLWSYLEGYQKFAPRLESYSKAYQNALPKVEAFSAFRRFRIRYINISILTFHIFNTNYARFLSFCFGAATFLKFFWWLLWEIKPADSFVLLGQQTFSQSTVLFTGLYLFVFSYLYVLGTQIRLHNNPDRTKHSSLTLLVDLVGKEHVYAIIGNPGSAGQNAVRINGKNCIYGISAIVGGCVVLGAGQAGIDHFDHWSFNRSLMQYAGNYQSTVNGGKPLTHEQWNWCAEQVQARRRPRVVLPTVPHVQQDVVPTVKHKAELQWRDVRVRYENFKEFSKGLAPASWQEAASKPPKSPKK